MAARKQPKRTAKPKKAKSTVTAKPKKAPSRAKVSPAELRDRAVLRRMKNILRGDAGPTGRQKKLPILQSVRQVIKQSQGLRDAEKGADIKRGKNHRKRNEDSFSP